MIDPKIVEAVERAPNPPCNFLQGEQLMAFFAGCSAKREQVLNILQPRPVMVEISRPTAWKIMAALHAAAEAAAAEASRAEGMDQNTLRRQHLIQQARSIADAANCLKTELPELFQQ